MAQKRVHSPYTNFKRWLLGHGITYKDIGDLLGLSVTTVSNKTNGQSDFTLLELQRMINEYGLPEGIFLDSYVA